MAATAQALNTFFNSFSVPAYMNNSVPDDAPIRHITYPVYDPEWSQKHTLYCEVWDRTTNNEWILSKADEICRRIGEGILLACDGGCLRINLENPIVQIRVSGDLRSAYINMSLNAFHLPGA